MWAACIRRSSWVINERKPMAASDSTAIARTMNSEEAAPPAWRRWVILGLLSTGAILAFASRTNISTVLAYKDFVRVFHLSDVDRGMLNSAFFWSYAVLQIPMGLLVDRYGVKIPYSISFVIWCLASAATGTTRTLSELTTMRVVTGAGEAIVVPASYSWMRKNFSDQESGLAVGLYQIGTKLGPAIATPLAVWLTMRYGWKSMFILIGLVGMIWLVPWLLVVEKDVPTAAEKLARSRGNTRDKVPFRNIIVSPVVWGSIIIIFGYNYFTFYCMTWMPAYLVERRHLTLSKMGLYQFFSFIGIAIVAVLAGWAADLMIKRGWDPVPVRKWFVFAGFVVGSTELFGGRTASVHVALFWAVVSLSGLGLATANHLALCRLTLIPARAVGLVTGLQNVSTSIAGIVAPLLSGWLKQRSGGYTLPMEAAFAFLVVSAVSCLVTLRREWAPKVAAPALA